MLLSTRLSCLLIAVQLPSILGKIASPETTLATRHAAPDPGFCG
ncbi:MAG TPA: hypothetical protein VFI55_09565 [Mycobacterium sp.]|nr:hypothetical protein [Mycobacterium sp.]